MHKLDNGLYYTVEHYRIPNWDIKVKKKGKPEPEYLVRFLPSIGKWRIGNILLDLGKTSMRATGGKTIVHIRNESKEILATGIALCSMSDNYCYKTGRELALVRAKTYEH
jgi:hypothetical protein